MSRGHLETCRCAIASLVSTVKHPPTCSTDVLSRAASAHAARCRSPGTASDCLLGRGGTGFGEGSCTAVCHVAGEGGEFVRVSYRYLARAF